MHLWEENDDEDDNNNNNLDCFGDSFQPPKKTTDTATDILFIREELEPQTRVRTCSGSVELINKQEIWAIVDANVFQEFINHPSFIISRSSKWNSSLSKLEKADAMQIWPIKTRN